LDVQALVKDWIRKLRPENNITTDTFFNGRVKVNQKRQGYRFSLDAVLLAAIPKPKPFETVVDIGTGCGVVPILMGFRHPEIRLFGVELQKELADVAMKNVLANRMQDRITILEKDIRQLGQDMVQGPVDWIVSNPPYRPANSGRLNPNSEKAMARHEIHLNLHDLIQASRRLLRTGGRLATIYPSTRLVELFIEMRSAGIEPKWVQYIHSRTVDEAKLVLVQGRMGGNMGLETASPLMIYDADGQYTPAVRQMMDP
jgi:tRNA1Val (adenine37-N6)-methyltransferase